MDIDPTPTSRADAETAAVQHALLERLLDDEAGAGVRPLAEYQAAFPGHEDLVATVVREVAGETRVRFEGRERIGPYALVEQIGRGGQGTVFLARDTRLPRVVALKLLSNGDGHLGPAQVERFRREAEAASRLDHPGICAVYETGEDDGVLYLAMRHVPGESLAMVIARSASRAGTTSSRLDLPGTEGVTSRGARRREVDAVVHLIEKVARALHVAHEAGIVHRDIKPGNVMVPPDGDPVILDFGLARDLEDAAPDLTRTDEVFGTPAYMALEQLRPGRRAVDRRADVYALGVTLFECLTLQRPYAARNQVELADALDQGLVPTPRQLVPSLPSDLAVVVGCAMSTRPDSRYATALAFAEDLRAVRELEPIKARPAGIVVRLGRWLQRNPWLAASQALVFLSLSIGLLVSLSATREADRQRSRADRSTYAAQMVAGYSQLTEDPVGAERQLASTDAARRGFEADLLAGLLDRCEHLQELTPGSVRACAYDPTGRALFAEAQGRDVRLADFATGATIRTIRCEEPVVEMVFSHDAQRIALSSGPDDGHLRRASVFATAGGEALLDVRDPDLTAEGLQFSKDGRFVMSDAARRTVFDLETGQWCQHRGRRGAGWILPDSRQFVLAGTVYELWSGERTGEREPFDVVYEPQPGGDRIAGISNYSNAVWLRDREGDGTARALMRYGIVPSFVRWSVDGRLLLSGSLDEARIVVHDVAEHVVIDLRLASLLAPPALTPDGRRLLAATARGIEEFAVADSGNVLGPHDDFVTGVALSPDGALVAGSSTKGQLWLWDADAGDVLRGPVAVGHRQQLAGVAFAEDPGRVFGYSRWNKFHRHALTGSREQARKFSAVRDGGPAEFFSGIVPGGRLTRAWTSSAQGWATVPEFEELKRQSDMNRTLLWRADSPPVWVASMHSDRWYHDAEEAAATTMPDRVRQRLPRGERRVAAAFSADGALLAVGTTLGVIVVYELAGGSLVSAIDAHIGPVHAVAFTPDGRLLSGGVDHRIHLWDAMRGDQLGTLRGHRGSVEGLAVSADGSRLASASSDRTIRLWDTRPVWQRRRQARMREALADQLEERITATVAEHGPADAIGVLWRAPDLTLPERQAARRRILRTH